MMWDLFIAIICIFAGLAAAPFVVSLVFMICIALVCLAIVILLYPLYWLCLLLEKLLD